MILLKLFQPMGADFVVYFEAAKMFLQGLNPYKGLFTRTFPFNYPPPALLFLWPLGFFDFTTANIMWNVASLLSVLISIALLLKIAVGRLNWPLWVVISFAFTVMYFPVKFNIGNAQINHYLLLLSVLSLFFYQSKHKNWSALFLAFASGIKLAPAIFVLYFIIKKDWKQVIRFLLFLAVIFVLPTFYVPLSYQINYYRDVLPLSFTLGAKDWYYNQSLFGFLARSLKNPLTITMSYYLLAPLVIFLTWWRGRGLNFKRTLSAVSCLYLLIHPIALQHYFAFAIIPFVLLGTDAKGKDWIFLITAYLLLAFDIKNFAAVPREFNYLLSHDFYGVLILWLLSLWPNKIWDIIQIIWVIAIAVAYILVLLCRGSFCI